MRRRIKRSSLFTMVAIVALLSLGIGYAAWTQNLTVDGSVDLAAFDVNWTAANGTDNETSTEIGSCTVTLTSDSVVTVALANAYPGYVCDVTTTITNASDISVVVSEAFNHDAVSANGLDISAVDCPTSDIAAGGTDDCNFTVTVNDNAPVTGAVFDFEASIEFSSPNPS